MEIVEGENKNIGSYNKLFKRRRKWILLEGTGIIRQLWRTWTGELSKRKNSKKE